MVFKEIYDPEEVAALSLSCVEAPGRSRMIEPRCRFDKLAHLRKSIPEQPKSYLVSSREREVAAQQRVDAHLR